MQLLRLVLPPHPALLQSGSIESAVGVELPVHFSQHFWQPGSGSLSTLSCSAPPPGLSSMQFNKGPSCRLSGRGQELAPVGTRPSGGGGAQKLDRGTHWPVHRPDFQKALRDGIILCRNTNRLTDIENNLIVAKGQRWGKDK